MRNASCFVILSHVDNSLHFLKEASKSNFMFVHQIFPDLSIKVSNFAYERTKTLEGRVGSISNSKIFGL